MMKTILQAVSGVLLLGFAKVVKRLSRLREHWQQRRDR